MRTVKHYEADCDPKSKAFWLILGDSMKCRAIEFGKCFCMICDDSSHLMLDDELDL
jgi:hypothetical protein